MLSFRKGTLAVVMAVAGFVVLHSDARSAEASYSPRTEAIYSLTMYWHHPQYGSYTTAAHVGTKWLWNGSSWRHMGYTGVAAMQSHVARLQSQGYRLSNYRYTFIRYGTW